MARYIDADAIIEFIDLGHYKNPLELCYSEQYVVDMIESRPTADVVEVVHGKWVVCDAPPTWWYECSICHKAGNVEYNYCPNCGADMRGGR